MSSQGMTLSHVLAFAPYVLVLTPGVVVLGQCFIEACTCVQGLSKIVFGPLAAAARHDAGAREYCI